MKTLSSLTAIAFGLTLMVGCACSNKTDTETKATSSNFTKDQEVLLEEISEASFKYFWESASPLSGLAPDQLDVPVSSVAAQGFAFAVMPIGVERGYVTRDEAEQRTLMTIETLENSNARHEGLFAHYINLDTGMATERGYESVSSSIDSALLAAGLIVVSSYFEGEVRQRADQLFAEMNWKYYLNNDSNQVYMAWEPDDSFEVGEGHFHKQTWDWYTDEALLISMLGIASPNEEYRLPEGNLTAWNRPVGTYGDHTYVYSWPGTLFTYTFAQCFYDFRPLGPDPGGIDWFQNTVSACSANRDWCRDHATEFATYGHNRWGITAGSGSGERYIVPGHLPSGHAADTPEDGTLHPYGAAMALPFIPEDAVAALSEMRNLDVAGKPLFVPASQDGYGFFDGFNLDQEWVSEDIIGIAHGPMLICIENARTGLIHELFMNHPTIKEGIDRAWNQ